MPQGEGTRRTWTSSSRTLKRTTNKRKLHSALRLVHYRKRVAHQPLLRQQSRSLTRLLHRYVTYSITRLSDTDGLSLDGTDKCTTKIGCRELVSRREQSVVCGQQAIRRSYRPACEQDQCRVCFMLLCTVARLIYVYDSVDKKKKFSRKRNNEEEGDITYINERNRVFNKKVRTASLFALRYVRCHPHALLLYRLHAITTSTLPRYGQVSNVELRYNISFCGDRNIRDGRLHARFYFHLCNL